MHDRYEALIQANLDIAFGPSAGIGEPPGAGGDAKEGHWVALRKSVSPNIFVKQRADGLNNPKARQGVFDAANALPKWLTEKAKAACGHDPAKLKAAVVKLLDDDFTRRRLIDYILTETDYFRWKKLDSDEQQSWLERRLSEVRDNSFNVTLNTFDFVMKVDNTVIGQLSPRESPEYHWFIKSIGSLVLINFCNDAVYEFTKQSLEARYKTPFIKEVFDALFTEQCNGPDFARWVVLVVGDITKIFGLGDYSANLALCQEEGAAPLQSVKDLFVNLITNFDHGISPIYPESRFRIGAEPGAMILNRLGALFWLKKTLHKAKSLQDKTEKTAAKQTYQGQGLLQAALEQKSIVNLFLLGQGLDTELNPCLINKIGESVITLQSPQSNKINQAPRGQAIQGYFSIASGASKDTYCDFCSTVVSITNTGGKFASVEIKAPTAFDLTRRSHKRIEVEPSSIVTFTLSVPPAGSDKAIAQSLNLWPKPLLALPEDFKNVKIKDISAGGMLLEIKDTAAASDFFVADNKNAEALIRLHLVAMQSGAALNVCVKALIRRIREYKPAQKKFVGLQFREVGEVKKETAVRWAEVGREGVWAIGDWMYRCVKFGKGGEQACRRV